MKIAFITLPHPKLLGSKTGTLACRSKSAGGSTESGSFAEDACIDILRQFLPPEIIPESVIVDRTDFVLITTPPPENAVLWEDDLSNGRIDLQIAVQCGELLATVHNETAEHPELKTMFKDTKAFEQLRIEPHYEYVTNSFPDLKKVIDAQTKRLKKETYALVLADLRPCNVWINSGQLYWLIFPPRTLGTRF